MANPNDIKEDYNLVNNFVESYFYSPGFGLRFIKHIAKNLDKFDPTSFPSSFKLWGNELYKTPNLTIDEKESSHYDVKGININPNQNIKGFPTKKAVIAHELGHYVDDLITAKAMNERNLADYSESYPVFRKNSYLLKLTKTAHPADRPILISNPNVFLWGGVYHDALPSESYADLMSMRLLLYNYKIYDSKKANNPFTIKHLYLFKLRNPDFRLFKYFTDELIIQMMNEVAQNNTDLTTDYEIS